MRLGIGGLLTRTAYSRKVGVWHEACEVKAGQFEAIHVLERASASTPVPQR